MARPADKNSKRQRGFRILNQYWNASPAIRLAKLMSELKVSKPYAETIIATHRREGLKTGAYVTVYKVMDKRNGKPCKPYMSSHPMVKGKVKKKDSLTIPKAKAAYVDQQHEKIDLVKGL